MSDLAKGRFLASDRTKMLAIKAAYPLYTITIVFQNPLVTLSKKSRTTYADWCDQHGIQWRRG